VTLLIDRIAQAAERDPSGRLVAGIDNATLWRRSGGVASWLIAQGYGPGGKSLAASAGDPALVLGALRAGAAIDPAGERPPANIAADALANLPVDAAVAERRLHITADTPIRPGLRHGDLTSLAQALG
jgi:hypothetical protein